MQKTPTHSKSAFFMGNRIVLITNNITASEQASSTGLLSVNRPGAYIWHEEEGYLHLSCSSFETANTYPFTLVLAGVWSIEATEDTSTVTCAPSGCTHHPHAGLPAGGPSAHDLASALPTGQ